MQSTVMEGYQSGPANYSISGIESKINLFMPYNPLEMQLNQPQQLQEPEDPPETFHTPWGVWLHWRDALHHIDQTYDAAHVVRTGMAAEDILHYAHYVPVVGEHEHAAESYEMRLEYDYSSELIIYNSEINVKENEETDDIEIIETFTDVESEENLLNAKVELEEAENTHDDEELTTQDNKTLKNDLDLELEKELKTIFEKLLMMRVNG